MSTIETPIARVPTALDLPEVLVMVGEFILLWDVSYLGQAAFRHQNLLPCLSVSRHFRRSLLPVFWRTVDGYAMRNVPEGVLREYAEFARVLRNPLRREDIRRMAPLYTTAINIQTTHDLEGHARRLIRRNPRLQELDLSLWRPEAEDVTLFSHLGQLSTLRLATNGQGVIATDPEFLSRALASISRTLVSLQMQAKVFLHACRGHLFLPELKVLRLDGTASGQVFDSLPEMCPVLETLDVTTDTNESGERLEALFRSGHCPKLVNWTTPGQGNNEQLARLIRSHRQGFQELDIRIEEGSDDVKNAVKQHGNTLRKLQICSEADPEITLAFLIDILQSCRQLQSFEFENIHGGGVSSFDVNALLNPMNWSSPATLENLAFTGPALKLNDLSLESDEWQSMDESFHNWRLINPSWQMESSQQQKREFLKGLFGRAGGFQHLRTITLNGVIYWREF
ncbi:hypothetical protein BC939DRAFT_502079 [Gamsiella multidivaricata]|uniref:uncharacterized protein n=1 Tax=Gamsiella multidivaricata TaxID=101098 RepID=UPI002220BC00|nr:uncharacterized protein BC939DRAFT_502079 [Gamsiella multidivaricata]KAG0366396.1 hypothetical protein BGZ54_005404 [Gamsiella multidivaricata]KAI7825624.1 hypothetical protein BC939DRAFT_502079 [Gamsiella multidivaricata]